MTETTKKTRRDHWKGLNFHGTIDWAVDLQRFTDDEYLNDEQEDDLEQYEEWPPALSSCDGSYDSIDAIEKAGNSIPNHCKDRYIVEVLKKMHSTALSDYDKLINGGYDKKFKTYADAVVKSGKSVVDKFMHDKGNDYFTCDVTESATCCAYCHYVNNPEEGQCRHCELAKGDCGGWDTVCEQPEVQCGEVPTVCKISYHRAWIFPCYHCSN
jgi:chitinase